MKPLAARLAKGIDMRCSRTSTLLLRCAMVAILGCESGKSGSDAEQLEGVGCNFAWGAYCHRYDGEWAEESLRLARDTCAEEDGTWGGCPVEPTIGICSELLEGPRWYVVVYYPGSVCSVAAASDRCVDDTTSGVLTPGAATCGGATVQSIACDLRVPLYACVTHSGPIAPEEAGVLASQCAAEGGAIIDACPDATVGTCGFVRRDRTVRVGYFVATQDANAARCEGRGGTWTDAP